MDEIQRYLLSAARKMTKLTLQSFLFTSSSQHLFIHLLCSSFSSCSGLFSPCLLCFSSPYPHTPALHPFLSCVFPLWHCSLLPFLSFFCLFPPLIFCLPSPTPHPQTSTLFAFSSYPSPSFTQTVLLPYSCFLTPSTLVLPLRLLFYFFSLVCCDCSQAGDSCNSRQSGIGCSRREGGKRGLNNRRKGGYKDEAAVIMQWGWRGLLLCFAEVLIFTEVEREMETSGPVGWMKGGRQLCIP